MKYCGPVTESAQATNSDSCSGVNVVFLYGVLTKVDSLIVNYLFPAKVD